MPLRADVNAEILAWLTPAALRRLNATWRARGYGHPDPIIDELAEFLDRPDFDYENLLAHLEAQYLGDAREGFARAYHGLYAWLAQVVSQVLFRRQVQNRDTFREGLQYYQGLAHLARRHRPLWIFSQNHDVLIECIAALFGIEVSAGFSSHTVVLPCRNAEGRPIAVLRANLLTDRAMADGRVEFFKRGWPGINLLKLHGALDIFTFGDGRDLIRLKPEDETFDAIIDALQIANEGLLDPNLVSGLVPDPLATMNKIPYIDTENRPQLLGRTLLDSAARLTDPTPQLMQRRWLEFFRAGLADVARLVAIGTSFGDHEINEIVLEWLAGAPERRLEIVAPGVLTLPTFLRGHDARVELTAASATTYLDRFLEETP
jgi:hypothetical protein